MPMQPNDKALALLAPAYRPCPAFEGPCSSMRWAPRMGHVPRGFCGAAGSPEEVQLVLVCAEPGDPHPEESYQPVDLLESVSSYVYRCYRDGTDLFHRNVRDILDLCFPGISFQSQMRRSWITDSVLCSAKAEGSHVPAVVARECRTRYLEAQLASFPNAVIAALGAKARDRLKGFPGVIAAVAAAPPGCNRREARDSWRAIAAKVHARAC